MVLTIPRRTGGALKRSGKPQNVNKHNGFAWFCQSQDASAELKKDLGNPKMSINKMVLHGFDNPKTHRRSLKKTWETSKCQ
jgi:hypothetical protein